MNISSVARTLVFCLGVSVCSANSHVHAKSLEFQSYSRADVTAFLLDIRYVQMIQTALVSFKDAGVDYQKYDAILVSDEKNGLYKLTFMLSDPEIGKQGLSKYVPAMTVFIDSTSMTVRPLPDDIPPN